MADEIRGKEFVDLIQKIDSSTGKSIGETILDIASGQTKIREGFTSHLGSASRDISETLARGRGYLNPIRQTSDQEIDRMMAKGTGLEILRGADRKSLENLTNENSLNTPTSAYNEGGGGLYFSVEAASDQQIKNIGISNANHSGQYTASHYAKMGTKEGQSTGIMRAIIPSSAKIANSFSDEYRKDVGTRFERIISDLDEMEKAGLNVSQARNVLLAIKSKDQEYASADVLSGYDAVALESNEVRLINRPAALSSGVKSTEQITQLYPETARTTRARGSGIMKHYTESMQERHQMAVARNQSQKLSLDGTSPPTDSRPFINIGSGAIAARRRSRLNR